MCNLSKKKCRKLILTHPESSGMSYQLFHTKKYLPAVFLSYHYLLFVDILQCSQIRTDYALITLLSPLTNEKLVVTRQ